MSSPDLSSLLSSALPLLLDWYRLHRKSLPWRDEPSPYHVWISEVMLQQTRIEAVIPYYRRFMERLPSVRALASVSDEELMKLWQGLGYYSRARNLKKAALTVTEAFDGSLPASAALLKKLPGIGDYTAGAIASIAFGQPEPAVDGNVMRVFARLTDDDTDVTLPAAKIAVTDALRAVYPSGEDAGLVTQAWMELGETVCIPAGAPLCDSCPLRSLCLGKAAGRAALLPVRSTKKPRRVEELTVFLLFCGDRICIRKRPASGLLAGLWEFPHTEGILTAREVSDAFGGIPALPLGDARHIFTHVEWHMTGYRLSLPEPLPDTVLAAPEEIRSRYAIPTAFRFYRDRI